MLKLTANETLWTQGQATRIQSRDERRQLYLSLRPQFIAGESPDRYISPSLTPLLGCIKLSSLWPTTPLVENNAFLLPDAVPIAFAEAQVYFFHIPKTSGTSFKKLLEAIFQQSEICAPGLWSHLIDCPRAEVISAKLIHGHFYALLHKYVNTPRRYITMLRHPFARAISHYRHVVRYSGHYLHEKTLALGSFGAFIRDGETNPLISNFYAKSLTWDHDVMALHTSLSKQELLNLSLEKYIETSPLHCAEALALEMAKQRLGQFAFVGITERFGESSAALFSQLGWALPDDLPIENVDPESGAATLQLSESDQRVLTDLNRVDLQLYAFAVESFVTHRDSGRAL